MIHRPLWSWIALVGLVALMSSACGDSAASTSQTTQTTVASTTTTTTSATTTTATPSTTTTAEPSITAVPAEGEPWDVLFLDFAEMTTRLPGELLTDRLTDELGVEVRLQEAAGFDHIYAATLVQQLRGDRYPSLAEYVPPAEVIVVLTRPGGPDATDHVEADYEKCQWTPLNGEAPTTDLSGNYWAAFRQSLDEVFAEMWSLREDQPTVIVAVAMFNSKLASQEDGGIDEECIAWYESMSDQIAEAAARNGALFVSLHDIFNGEAHDIDAVTAGLAGPTDADPSAEVWTSTPAGATRYAEALITTILEAINQR